MADLYIPSNENIAGENIAGENILGDTLTEKLCSGCGRWKAIEEFYRDRAFTDGYKQRCKKCVRRKNATNHARRAYSN